MSDMKTGRKTTSVDWKASLLQQGGQQGTGQVGRAAVVDALQQGADPAELKALVETHGTAFDADARAAASLLDTKTAPLAKGAAAGAGAGQRAHLLQLDPGAALPWWKQARLPVLPAGLDVQGPARSVQVGQETFSPADVQQLLLMSALL